MKPVCHEGASRIARWMLLVAVGTTGALGLAACLGSVNRFYGDGGTESSTTGDDATVDSAAEAAPGMDGAVGQDGDAMVIRETAPAETSPPPNDAPAEVAPPGQTFLCNGQMVTSCASCANNPIECVFCAQDGGHPGVCGPQNTFCTNSAPQGAAVCMCPGGNVAPCPAPFQVCSFILGAYYCQTCGEMMSATEPCKGGGHCSVNGMCL